MSTRSFFIPDGDAFIPTDWARGPWGDTISGNYVGGLLGHVIERDASDPEMQPARLTVDLFRPAALADPVCVETAIVREGRRLKLVDATMTRSGTVVARANALFLRRGEQPPGPRWSTDVAMPPVPPVPDPVPNDVVTLVWTYGKFGDTPSVGLAAWAHHGPKYIWTRDLESMVAGVELTAFTRAAMAGDMASSLTHFGADGLPFINADYTLTLSRLPEGPYLGLAALTHHSHAGVATGTAVVVDASGPIGTATATALANPGFNPPRATL
ncbi:acyl-CoA thioesterase domain-containing protein [Mycobacterium sp. 236(2023)]|uniref:acyl-CoA thioesterase domain-containing protein n=1 Tax=Mycobacterium sp. 236(2023) TaxID=3038163 RepID=UPI002414E879|nr:acyl-CoA thioesterase domain-containing protein [Mycobacterium sp. 236(2023)]MDG4667379.1 thioesterase family protein [Mycobacterium sp. 236(2023)]